MRAARENGFPGRWAALAVWCLTRTALLLCVLKVLTVPGPDVTSDVSVIYHGWYDVLTSGTFPVGDVTWQYPPAAALPVLAPGALPFLSYPHAFFVLALLADAVVYGLLAYACRGGGRSAAGVWVWVCGVPLLGPTVLSRYDVMVTAVAVAALLAGARRARSLGVLAAFGALLKVWPVFVLLGTPRGRPTRASWTTAAVTAAVLLGGAWLWLPGSLDFLTAQRDRGTEVESLGALVFQFARHHGWQGEVRLNYGSVEFLGPHVALVSDAAQALSVLALGWLVLWRLRARVRTPGTPADAAFVAVLLFTTTSRVISPQYMVWLLGLGAVCLTYRRGRMVAPVCLVLAATAVTLLEFPLGFGHVVAGDTLGVTLLVLRNGLLVAACGLAGWRLWRSTVGPRAEERAAGVAGAAGARGRHARAAALPGAQGPSAPSSGPSGPPAASEPSARSGEGPDGVLGPPRA
ncbi:glycosyltransferase 87 family protein [Streptomyces sp. NPDC050560]|uniref:glycosyltransferase 87 family protein n=1 Tax=Streptomyces sp. NPDC050560 TaxID=3365630 RepID=UPI0037A8A0E6